jgi:hypothetical protein
MAEEEQELVGNVTSGVVRVGATVRRPVGPWTDTVDSLLLHLRDVGFTGAPRPLGRDDKGRQVVEYIPGEAGRPGQAYSLAELSTIGELLADYHAAVAGFVAPAGAVWNTVIPADREEIICHNDAAPWNLVRSARGWVLIDWDAAGPGSRQWDLAYSAQTMAGLDPNRTPPEAARRLRALVDGYGPPDDLRATLPAMLGRRSRAMYDLLRAGARKQEQPWARIWIEDGPYWLETSDYLDANVGLWTACLE